MTVQFGRQARLVVGSPGNPGQIGTPATPASVQPTTTPLATNVPANDPRITAPTSPTSTLTAYKNPDGTYNLYDSSSSGISTTPATAGTPNVAATPGQGLDLSQLRFSFNIEHHVIQTPGTMECRIYNLSDATASKIQTEFTRIQLTAGYEGNSGMIFNGTIASGRGLPSGWLVAFAPIIGTTPRSATPSQLGQRLRSSLATVPLRRPYRRPRRGFPGSDTFPSCAKWPQTPAERRRLA